MTNHPNNFPKLHNAAWPGVVGKDGGEGSDPPIPLDTMLDMTAAADEVERMRRYLPVLDTMITVAPLLGIFGTVIGIISSFEILGTTGIEHPREVTVGIAQALITTASGLGIAILSVFPYNYFLSRTERATLLIEKYATSLEIVYEKLLQRDDPVGKP